MMPAGGGGTAAWDDDPEGFDDVPELELDDEDYEAFLARELDPDGRIKGDPPVGRIILIVLVCLLVLALAMFL